MPSQFVRNFKGGNNYSEMVKYLIGFIINPLIIHQNHLLNSLNQYFTINEKVRDSNYEKNGCKMQLRAQ